MRPEQTTAWRSLDGSLWPTEAEAMENDARRGAEASIAVLNAARRAMSNMSKDQGVGYLIHNADRIKEAADHLKELGYEKS